MPEPVVVARAAAGQRPYCPNAIRLACGRILAAYREGAGHVRSVGRILAVASDDDGRTWSDPWVVVDTLLDDRDPMLTQLSNGDVLLMYFRIDWSRTPWDVPGVQVVRSTDDGATFGEAVEVRSAMQKRTARRWHRYRSGHIASHGRILELPGGDLLAPVYGIFAEDAEHSASVVRSTDGGLTWPKRNEVIVGRKPGTYYLEPVLTLLPDGQVVALLRTEEAAELARSDDGGLTWSDPEVLELWAHSADTAMLSDGSVLLAYGDASRTRYTGRPTLATVIPDPTGPWDTGGQHLVYNAGHDTFDQANPSVVELSRGLVMVLTYDIFRRQIVAVRKRRSGLR
jgi:hypothetical protein